MLKRLLYYRDKFDANTETPFTVPSRPFSVFTDDGESLYGSHLAGTGERAFLVVHGLFAHHRAPGIREFCESLTRAGDVYAVDLRGHGLSTGSCTLGNREALDVAAATREVRLRTGSAPVLVGFSLGAAAAVRSAALHEPADAVVAISCPARWDGPRRWAAKRTALIFKLPLLPSAARMLTGVRLHPHWVACESPAEVAERLAPCPLLVVHGEADTFFPLSEARDLYSAALEPKDLWIVDSGGHAEGLYCEPGRAVDPSRVGAFVDEIVKRVNHGRSP